MTALRCILTQRPPKTCMSSVIISEMSQFLPRHIKESSIKYWHHIPFAAIRTIRESWRCGARTISSVSWSVWEPSSTFTSGMAWLGTILLPDLTWDWRFTDCPSILQRRNATILRISIFRQLRFIYSSSATSSSSNVWLDAVSEILWIWPPPTSATGSSNTYQAKQKIVVSR